MEATLPAGRTRAAGRAVSGVLFDIDDTLVDLDAAARAGFLRLSAAHLARIPDADRERAAAAFSSDAGGFYERYMAGELTFAGQRMRRISHAYALVGGPELPEAELARFTADFEDAVRPAWRPFDDVHPCLDELDRLGVPYGAVSNNVAAYQREKLDITGLERIRVLVGSDTAGAPKPDPRPFLAGADLLGLEPADVLYVGDNPLNDVRGALEAGLRAALLDRSIPEGTFPEGTLPEGAFPVMAPEGGGNVTGLAPAVLRTLAELPGLISPEIRVIPR
ncbi:haloacid dehalogenase [Zafaria cholistanensis]|uniref:Haloacid dehalogenase n=1 Tax=Zafaria cholistanensis TaxID=1682741 RepID=A0A5A7NPC0_9MICC|nr:HAD family hydrolase [Zafaria cholistanensis]GER21897.1 haloacid dehalogenase [Zafaria cholistanensis]